MPSAKKVMSKKPGTQYWDNLAIRHRRIFSRITRGLKAYYKADASCMAGVDRQVYLKNKFQVCVVFMDERNAMVL
jgi:hypothetical protein